MVKCKYESGCPKRASYGLLSGVSSSAQFCKNHVPVEIKDSFEDVIHKKCKFCKKRPNFGPIDGDSSTAIYCNAHIPGDEKHMYEDVTHKRCKLCKTQPTFGPLGGGAKSAIFCKDHVPVEQIEMFEDISHKKCKDENCKKRPNFGLIGTKIAIYCKDHIPQGQQNLYIDIHHKTCLHPTCKTRPYFGLINSEEKEPIYCEKHVPLHRKHEFGDIIHETCLNDWCTTRISNEIYRGYCLRCFAHKFPLEKGSRNYKTKERLVVQKLDEVLKEHYNHLEADFDKKVQNGCSARRPDVAIDCFTHVVIIEIDENSHKTEDCSCEEKRMMILMQDFGTRPIVFVRFNPDAYVNSKREKIASCFKIKKETGLLQIVSKNKWETRLDVLVERMKFHLNNIPEREMEIEHLYYNGFH